MGEFGKINAPAMGQIIRNDVDTVLSEHEQWVETGGQSGRQGDLSNKHLEGYNFVSKNMTEIIGFGVALNGAKLTRVTLDRATLHSANLHGAYLSFASLKDIDLTNAILSKVRADQAIFERAHMPKADCSEAIMPQVNFKYARLNEINLERASLMRSDFYGASLEKANLKDAVLVGANLAHVNLALSNLTGADLRGAKLCGSDLRNCTLSAVSLLEVTQLAGLDLTGAKLPEDVSRWESLSHLAEGTRRAAKLFTPLILGCFLCLLIVIFGWFVTNGNISLPGAKDYQVPLTGYYWAGPVVLIGFYAYFCAHMQRLWETLAMLPAVFPDGATLDRKANPWLPLGYMHAHIKLVQLHKNVYGKKSELLFDRSLLAIFQILTTGFLLWWLVPLTVISFWCRYLHLTNKTVLDMAGQTTLAMAALGISLYFQTICRDTLRRAPAPPLEAKPRQRFGYFARRHLFKFAWWAIALEYLVVIAVLNW